MASWGNIRDNPAKNQILQALGWSEEQVTSYASAVTSSTCTDFIQACTALDEEKMVPTPRAQITGGGQAAKGLTGTQGATGGSSQYFHVKQQPVRAQTTVTPLWGAEDDTLRWKPLSVHVV